MTDGFTEVLVTPLTESSCETFCSSSEQLRLWLRPEKPTACGHCGSSAIVTGPIGGEALPLARQAWREAQARAEAASADAAARTVRLEDAGWTALDHRSEEES